jgi:peroxiredoxin
MGEKLDAGEILPSVTLRLAGGGTLRVPDELGAGYGVVLFYRGHW